MKLKGMLALLIVPMMIACSDDDDATGITGDIAGTYTLRTINGQNLPFTLITQTGYTLEVISDQYALNGDGTFSSAVTFRETENGAVTTSTDSYTGTWQRSGSNITLSSTDYGLETAAFSGGNTLTFTSGTNSAVYRK